MATYTLWYRGADSTASASNTKLAFPFRPTYIDTEVLANIPRFSSITKAVLYLELKRNGSTSSLYHTDIEWLVRNSANETITTLKEQSGVVTTSFKTFSQDYTDYVCSKTPQAGLINSALCDHFALRAIGTLSRTYTAQKRRIEYTFDKPRVTINTSENTNGGLITGSNTYEVEVADYNVTLTATPDNSHTFYKWVIDGNEYSSNSVSIPISQNNISDYQTTINAEAYFRIKTITVTTEANPPEGGTVTGGGTYESGSTVTATATPNTGYAFSHWLINGANAGSSNPISGALTSDTTVTAVFEKVETSKIYKGTKTQSVYRGTKKVSVYVGTDKIT